MVIVRDATENDVPQMVANHAAVAAEGRWIGTEAPVDTERFEALFRRTIQSSDGHLFVATVDGAVVGTLSLVPTTSGVMGLGMSIVSGHRGQGIGTELVTRAVDWARSNADIHKIELEVWPHNAAALALYLRCGFTVEGRRVGHYRRRNGELWDAIVMGLVLDASK